jgi:2-polyprenyl-3-methyl-5-hydroxy-6-metoxy-1,4-benzoquinol methylase
MESALTFNRVCPVERAGMLNSPLRHILVNPRKLLEEFVTPGMTCLDIGCGPGFFTVPMALLTGLAGEVTAADIQVGMLDLLQFRLGILEPGYPELKQIIRYCRTTEKGIGTVGPFDFVLVFHMLHEVSNQPSFARELMTLIKPEGCILIAEPAGHVSRRQWQNERLLLEKTGFRLEPGPKISFSRSVIARRPGP